MTMKLEDHIQVNIHQADILHNIHLLDKDMGDMLDMLDMVDMVDMLDIVDITQQLIECMNEI